MINRRTLPILAISLSVLGLNACAGSLLDELDSSLVDTSTGAAHFSVTIEDGVSKTQVDSSSYDDFVYLDMDTGKEVWPKEPGDNEFWDIRFKRMDMDLNSGNHGTGEVVATWIKEQDFTALTAAPSESDYNYYKDGETQGKDENGAAVALERVIWWWSYNGETHVLTPYDEVYVIRSTEGAYFKYRVLNYYTEAGSSGYPTVEWAQIDAPGT